MSKRFTQVKEQLLKERQNLLHDVSNSAEGGSVAQLFINRSL